MQTPHSVTRWRAQAIGMSPTKGVGISQIQKFNTEKSVFVDFIFPAKTIRFEVGFETKIGPYVFVRRDLSEYHHFSGNPASGNGLQQSKS